MAFDVSINYEFNDFNKILLRHFSIIASFARTHTRCSHANTHAHSRTHTLSLWVNNMVTTFDSLKGGAALFVATLYVFHSATHRNGELHALLSYLVRYRYIITGYRIL